MTVPIQLIAGLGNPGPQYENTRHNAGVWFVGALAEQFTAELKLESKFKAQVAKVDINGNDCWLLTPITYMNCSGEAVAAFAKFYKIPPEAILIAHDELDFSPGDVRIKYDGGHGGHNGLRSIVQHLGSKDFYRLRIGIGRPQDRDIVSDYVLHKPAKSEKQQILDAIDEAMRIISDFVAGETEKAICALHSAE